MIIKGKSRSNGIQLAGYLLHSEENEQVSVLEVSGMATNALPDALREMQEITDSGQKGIKGLYHGVISPQPGYEMTRDQWIIAADELGRSLKLEQQPRAIVVHEKHGRAHAHVVFQRTDMETLKLIPDSWNYTAHEKAARKLEREWGHEQVPGAHVDPKKPEFERSDQADHDRQQAARSKLSRAERSEQITNLYRQSDSARSFVAALGSSGYILARGDRRDFVLIDKQGEAYSLPRYISGVKTKDVRSFMQGHAIEALPSVNDARGLVVDRAANDAQKDKAQSAFTKEAKPDGSSENKPQPKRPSKGTAVEAMGKASIETGWARYSSALATRIRESRQILKSVSAELRGKLADIGKKAAQKFRAWRGAAKSQTDQQDRTSPKLKDAFTDAIASKAKRAVKRQVIKSDKGPDHDR